jgi:hypothetical protein
LATNSGRATSLSPRSIGGRVGFQWHPDASGCAIHRRHPPWHRQEWLCHPRSPDGGH